MIQTNKQRLKPIREVLQYVCVSTGCEIHSHYPARTPQCELFLERQPRDTHEHTNSEKKPILCTFIFSPAGLRRPVETLLSVYPSVSNNPPPPPHPINLSPGEASLCLFLPCPPRTSLCQFRPSPPCPNKQKPLLQTVMDGGGERTRA